MSVEEAELSIAEVEAVLPATWLPDRPLDERIKMLVEARRAFVGAFEVLQLQVEVLERQRDSMRRSYLNLLRYARRVAAMEATVSQLLDAVEGGRLKMSFVSAVRAARDRLGHVEPVELPTDALRALEPFLRSKGAARVMLTGPQLDAFREVLRWAHGMSRD